MSDKHCSNGLDHRCRDADGEIRHKRGDTQIGTLRRHYGDDFAPRRRSDMRLDSLLYESGVPSLSAYLKRS